MFDDVPKNRDILRWWRRQAIKGPSYDGACVYLLFADEELLYVGATRQLSTRIDSHLQQEIIPFNKYDIVRVEDNKLSETEIALIKKYQPKYNFRHTDAEFEYDVSEPADISDVEHVFCRDDDLAGVV
jgi:predicted GIY-YIG superfamily endonuclease